MMLLSHPRIHLPCPSTTTPGRTGGGFGPRLLHVSARLVAGQHVRVWLAGSLALASFLLPLPVTVKATNWSAAWLEAGPAQMLLARRVHRLYVYCVECKVEQ
jgi:hypothetical protein